MADDGAMFGLNWYHMTTQENWPDPNFGLPSAYSFEHQNWMVARDDYISVSLERGAWNKGKAVHIGIYAAALRICFAAFETSR
ncbi:hypothetical protein ACUH88_01915 [Dermabacteraceae bacterium P13095]